MHEMNEQEIRTLNTITLNEPIMASDLSRMMWAKGIKDKTRDNALAELVSSGMIKAFKPRLRLRKRGPLPTMYEATPEGHQWIDDYIKVQDTLGTRNDIAVG